MEWVEHALRAAPSLRKVTLNLRGSTFQQHSHISLREVMIACSAALAILFCRKEHISFLCAGLKDATSLKDLTLSLRNGSYDLSDAEAILESLQLNSSLVRFDLELNSITERAARTGRAAIASLPASESFLAYFRNLRRNGSLKILSLRTQRENVFFNVDSSISGEIEDMFLECNSTLQHIEGLTFASVEYDYRIGRLLLLNRYGEGFVANATSVPMEHWGDVLMRIGKEECHFFLTDLVRRAVERWDHEL